MKRDALVLIRNGIVVAVVIVLVMFAELAIDLSNSGVPASQIVTFDIVEARYVTNLLKSNFNQLLAVVFTTVAIAVPLTANMYSLKFLEFFIKDPVNAAVLMLMVFAALNNAWVAYSLKSSFVPIVMLYLSFALVVLGSALLFPYLYYVFRFLHPNTLLVRLEAEVISDLQAAQRRPGRAAACRHKVAEGIEHIANVAIRSIDRGDRSTAIESVFCLERVARFYWQVKPRLPQAWFEADQAFFLGFASGAVEELTGSRSWVEMKIFSQMRTVLSAAVPRTHDVTDTIAKVLRRLGLEPEARRDVALREMVMEYFNTFIRLAITRKDPRSVFTLFDHYRIYAESLNPEHPDFVLEIAFYFEYYGQVARDGQLPFVVEAIAHDLGTLVQRAWQAQAANRDKLLERFLRYDEAAQVPLPGVKKAQALLASFFLQAGYAEPAELIRRDFLGLPPDMVDRLRDDLLHIKRAKYWEVNERRLNMDYVPDAQREKLSEFLDSVHAAAGA